VKPTDAQFDAILACSRETDGTFWYGVATTGIYCRPSCRSKAPLRENVRIFAAPREAEAAGFRACKRCAPNAGVSPAEESTESLETAAAFLRDRSAADVCWQQAAALVHLSPSRFHRLFRAHFGLAPGAYLNRCRLERAECEAKDVPTVIGRAYEAGFGSIASYYRTRRRFQSGTADG
jgi:AraC family transcriptional regulator, regulatory protein of adaptative response / methylated-DNA-[protein]-cysteine methyltransferase